MGVVNATNLDRMAESTFGSSPVSSVLSQSEVEGHVKSTHRLKTVEIIILGRSLRMKLIQYNDVHTFIVITVRMVN